MKTSPLELAKMVKNAIANKDYLEKKAKELESKPIIGVDPDGKVEAHLDFKTSRISKITGEADLEAIREAVNNAWDQADIVYNQLGEEIS